MKSTVRFPFNESIKSRRDIRICVGVFILRKNLHLKDSFGFKQKKNQNIKMCYCRYFTHLHFFALNEKNIGLKQTFIYIMQGIFQLCFLPFQFP